MGFVCVVAVFLVTLVLVLWKWTTAPVTNVWVRALCVVVLTCLAYPVIFTIDRGNLEMVVFVFLAAFFALYFRRRSAWAFLPLGLAIGFKYYWVMLLVLLATRPADLAGCLRRRRGRGGQRGRHRSSGGDLRVRRAGSARGAREHHRGHENARGGGLFDGQHGHSLWGLGPRLQQTSSTTC